MVEKSVKRIVKLPEGFSAEVKGNMVAVKGAGGEGSREFKAKGVSFRQENSSILIEGIPASRRMNAQLRTIASHIENMASGLQQPYLYRLAVVYSHFPMTIVVKGNQVEINNFTGEKSARHAKIMPNVTVEVKGKEVLVKGSSKEAAGQTAANLENATKVSGKDRRIYQDGIFIVEKALQGEAAEKAGQADSAGKGKQEGQQGKGKAGKGPEKAAGKGGK